MIVKEIMEGKLFIFISYEIINKELFVIFMVAFSNTFYL